MHESLPEPPETTRIRAYQDGDHIEIADIFTRAIHEIANADYTEEQRLA